MFLRLVKKFHLLFENYHQTLFCLWVLLADAIFGKQICTARWRGWNLYSVLQNRLWITSCSLLHVPVDLNTGVRMDVEIRSWLAFALQKIEELQILATALNFGRVRVQEN